jgi:hypothetical protein
VAVTFKTHPLTESQVHNTVLLTIVTMLHVRSPTRYFSLKANEKNKTKEKLKSESEANSCGHQ